MSTQMPPIAARERTMHRLIGAFRSARPGGPREALGQALKGENAQAIVDAYQAYVVLTKQEQWLSNNPTHPQFVEREDMFLVNLQAYELIESLIGEADSVRGIESERAIAWQTQGDRFIAWRNQVQASSREPEGW